MTRVHLLQMLVLVEQKALGLKEELVVAVVVVRLLYLETTAATLLLLPLVSCTTSR